MTNKKFFIDRVVSSLKKLSMKSGGTTAVKKTLRAESSDLQAGKVISMVSKPEKAMEMTDYQLYKLGDVTNTVLKQYGFPTIKLSDYFSSQEIEEFSTSKRMLVTKETIISFGKYLKVGDNQYVAVEDISLIKQIADMKKLYPAAKQITDSDGSIYDYKRAMEEQVPVPMVVTFEIDKEEYLSILQGRLNLDLTEAHIIVTDGYDRCKEALALKEEDPDIRYNIIINIVVARPGALKLKQDVPKRRVPAPGAKVKKYSSTIDYIIDWLNEDINSPIYEEFTRQEIDSAYFKRMLIMMFGRIRNFSQGEELRNIFIKVLDVMKEMNWRMNGSPNFTKQEIVTIGAIAKQAKDGEEDIKGMFNYMYSKRMEVDDVRLESKIPEKTSVNTLEEILRVGKGDGYGL